jgi:hypothetical protein
MKIRALAILSIVLRCDIPYVLAGPVGVQRNLSPDQRAGALLQLQVKQEQVGRRSPEPPKEPAIDALHGQAGGALIASRWYDLTTTRGALTPSVPSRI